MGQAEQDRVFTAAGAQAIRDGADIAQVVNARKGIGVAGTTTTGSTRLGLAGKRLGGRSRLLPEEIYRRAGSRDEAIALLKQHGFLI